MKYWCETCESLFDEADAIIERYDPSPRGISLPEGSYVIWRCPICGEEEIEPAAECELCGEYHNPRERDLCEECAKEIDSEIEAMIDEVSERHHKEYKITKEIIFDRLEAAWF